MSDKLLWWGYKHINGNIQAKRYFSREDIDEAHESPFVATVCGPFEATGRQDALDKLAKKMNV